MKKDKSRERRRTAFDRDFKIRKVDAHKELSRNWKRFLDSEDFD